MVKNIDSPLEGGPQSSVAADEQSDQYKMLSVLISGGNQNPVTIVIRKYQYGDSVAKLVNLCPDLTVTLKQKSSGTTWQLEPMREMFFVWPDLIKQTRELYWSLAEATPASSFSSQHYEAIKLTKSGNDKYQFMVSTMTTASSSHLSPDLNITSSPRTNASSDTETGKILRTFFLKDIFYTSKLLLFYLFFLSKMI